MLIEKFDIWLKGLSGRNIFFVFAFLGLCVYGNSIFHPFVHDDVVFIQKNPYIWDLNFAHIFKQTSTYDPSFPFVNTYYRPLLEALNRLLYKAFGLNPYGFHLFNVIVHIANTFLVYCVLNTVFIRSKINNMLIAVLFLVHPVQSEAVACVSGISNLFFTFFVLYVAFLYFRIRENAKSIKSIVAMYVLFILALLTKEQTIVLPVILGLYEICFHGLNFKKQKKAWLHIAGLFALLIGYFCLRRSLFGHAITSSLIFDGEFWLRILSIPRSILMYLMLMLAPHDLHYYRNIDMLAPKVFPFLGLGCVLGFLFYIFWNASKEDRSIYFFGLGWFGIALMPTLNIIPLVNEYSYLLSAEHFLYFPLVGFLIFFINWIKHFFQRKKQKAYMLMLVLIAVFCGMTIRQNQFWQSEVVLFERMMKFEQGFGRGHILLAEAYYHDGQYEKSIEESFKALDIMNSYLERLKNPKVQNFYIHFIKRSHLSIAHSYEAMGQFEYSPEHYQEILLLDPDSYVIMENLAMNYLKLGDLDSAVVYFEDAMVGNPDNLMVRNSLALCYLEQKNYVEAEKLFRYIVKHDPESVSAQQNLNIVLQKISEKK